MRRRVQVDSGSDRPARRRISAASTLALCVLVVLAACSGNNDPEPPPTIVTTTTTPPPQRVDDGALVIGVLIPAGDNTIGASLTDSFNATIADVNLAGGVLGQTVETVEADEGTTPAEAARAVEQLVVAGVDAIVGPMSSTTAIGALDQAVRAGVVTCSPTASAIILDEFPDDGLFFRTIATDTLQARAIAEQAQATGATKVAIVHLDDAYGRPYADAVERALDFASFAEVTTIPLAVGDTDLSDDVARLLDEAPQVAIVLGGGDDSAKFLEELGNRDSSGLTSIVVNDAARGATSRALITQLLRGLRERVTGVAPQVVQAADDGNATGAPFDAQVRDCVSLISLAALQARSDAPALIASQMSSVSAGGQGCTNFADCAKLLDQSLQINYDGENGMSDLGRNGDPDRATFDVFTFGEDGTDTVIATRTVTVIEG
jgi:branched-chain amino acid transport system substrate-binding protein